MPVQSVELTFVGVEGRYLLVAIGVELTFVGVEGRYMLQFLVMFDL